MSSLLTMDSRAGRDDLLALVARLRRGDAQALEPLYRSESGPVYRYALALCANPAWAADAMQEAFVALASEPESFDPLRGSLGGWLAGVARHHLLARWRRPDERCSMKTRSSPKTPRWPKPRKAA